MKKIISLISALAISAAAFSAMTVTSFAAPAANSEPKIQVWVDSVDSDNYAVIYAKLINNETLMYEEGSRGKITQNAINMIQLKPVLDPDVFVDPGEVYVSIHSSIAALTSKTEGQAPVVVFGPTAVAGYMTSVPEYLIKIEAYMDEAYSIDNIPADAITFADTIVEYTYYNDTKPESGATNYTIYANDATVAAGGTRDYDLACKFTGASTEWPADDEEDDDEPTVTPVAMDAGVEIAEGPHAGKTSVSAPEAVEVEKFTNITVVNDVDTSKTLEWTAPTTLGNGGSKVLPVLVFNKAENADSTFTITLWNAETPVKIFTHKVTQ